MKEPPSDSSTRSIHGETFEVSDSLQALLDQWEKLNRAGVDVSAKQLCEGNPALQRELESYLSCLQDFSRFELDDQGPMPEWIGPYEILAQLGQGGHAVVYLARQHMPSRKVALKLLQNLSARPRLESRFRLEIQLLGMLRHPNIARIFEAGTAEVFGVTRLYYTMEWINGQDVLSYIQERVRGGDWNASDTIRLCLKFSDALSEAHAEGVVHRDLKPANMLVDSDGNPKLIDFGLARTGVLGAEGRSGESTADGWVGTRVYMSPEQFGGDPALVDGRTDVYGFAVVLYQLLVDDLPYPIERATMWETARLVKETPPIPPSRRVASLRGDIDVILGKALSKEPLDRYATIDAFAEDLRATLEGRPIAARPPNAAVSLLKWCRRHQHAAVGSAISVALILILAVAALIFARRASDRAEDLTLANKTLHEQKADLLNANRRYDESLKRLKRTAFNQALLRLGTVADREPGYVRNRLEDDSVFPGKLRGYAWHYLHDTVAHSGKRWFAGSHGSTGVAISDDGALVACSGPMGTKVWDVASETVVAGFPDLLASPRVTFSLNGSGRSLLFCRSDGKVGWLDVPRNQTHAIPRPSGPRPSALAHAGGDGRFFIADDSGTVECWNADGPRLQWEEKLADEPIIGLRQGVGSNRFGAVTQSGVVILAKADSGELIESQQIVTRQRLRSGWYRARFSPDLSRVFVSQEIEEALIWDLEQQRSRQTWSDFGFLPDGDFRSVELGGAPDGFAISGRGRMDVVSREGLTFTLYRNVDEQQLRREIDSGERDFSCDPIALDVAEQSDCVAILLRGGGVVVRSCSAAAGYESWNPARATVAQLAFSPQASLLATASSAQGLGVHSVDNGELIKDWNVHRGKTLEIVFGTQEDYCLARSTSLGLVLWDAKKGIAVDTLGLPKEVERIAWIDRRVLLGMSAGNPVWLPVSGEGEQQRFGEIEIAVDDGILSFSHDPDSGLFATALESGDLVLWRLKKSGGLIRLKTLSVGESRYLAMKPHGETLVVGHRSGMIEVLSLPGLERVKQLQPNANRLGGIAFSPDGSVMASGHFDGEVLFWDVVNWEPQLSVQTKLSPIREMEFSSAGDLAVGGKGDELVLFRASTSTD